MVFTGTACEIRVLSVAEEYCAMAIRDDREELSPWPARQVSQQ